MSIIPAVHPGGQMATRVDSWQKMMYATQKTFWQNIKVNCNSSEYIL